jgi:hypothetical protein
MSGYHWLRFRCPNRKCSTDAVRTIVATPFEAPWPDSSDEIDADATIAQVYPAQCESCLSSYEVEVIASVAGHEANLIGHPETPVTIQEPEDFDALAERWEIPAPHPYVIFADAYEEVRFMVRELYGSDARNGSLHRMLFVHLFSMIEAYLADTVIGLSQRDSAVRRRLLEQLDGLREVKVPLIDAERGADLVRDSVRDHLRHQQYHRFDFVDRLYRIAIGSGILPGDKAGRADLFEAVRKRHDCVHRNGRDLEGNVHEVTGGELLHLGDLFLGIVTALDERVGVIDAARLEEERRQQTPDDYPDLPF